MATIGRAGGDPERGEEPGGEGEKSDGGCGAVGGRAADGAGVLPEPGKGSESHGNPDEGVAGEVGGGRG